MRIFDPREGIWNEEWGRDVGGRLLRISREGVSPVTVESGWGRSQQVRTDPIRLGAARRGACVRGGALTDFPRGVSSVTV